MLFGLRLVLPLMLIIITGNLLRRYDFLKDSDINCLTKLLYWVVLPALLFKTSYVSGREFLRNINLFEAVSCAFIAAGAVAWFISAKIFRRSPEDSAVSIMASIRSNNIYVGFPVIQMALGDRGLACAAVYVATTSVAFHAISIAGAELALHGRINAQNLKKICIGILLNPLLLACTAGIVFSLMPFGLPQPFIQATSMLGNAATAVALIALGASLQIESTKQLFSLFAATWYDNCLRFAIAPAIMLLSMRVFHIEPLLATVTVLLTCMPVAVNCFALAKEMHMDEKYMASVIASTTVVSAAAIPLWTMILKIG